MCQLCTIVQRYPQSTQGSARLTSINQLSQIMQSQASKSQADIRQSEVVLTPMIDQPPS